MEFNIDVRRKQLENLDQFISSSKDRVDSILDFLGWSAQKIIERQKGMEKCKINPSHRYLASENSKHLERCALRKEGYSLNEQFLSEPNQKQGSSIIIDDITKVTVLNEALVKNPLMKTGWRSHEPVPRTIDRLTALFTPEERLALYEYSVSISKGPPSPPEFNITKPAKEEKKDLTPDEIRALERDAKRRRIKYKTRSVHTNRKSTTEILREVIAGQMELYEEFCRGDSHSVQSDRDDNIIAERDSPQSSKHSCEEKNDEKKRKPRSRSRERYRHSRIRSRSRSKKHSEKYNDHKRHSHERDRQKNYHRSSNSHERKSSYSQYSSNCK